MSGVDPAPLSAPPLDPSGTFTLVNALRPLEPGASMKLLVAFNPQQCGTAYEVATVRWAVRVAALSLLQLEGVGIHVQAHTWHLASIRRQMPGFASRF